MRFIAIVDHLPLPNMKIHKEQHSKFDLPRMESTKNKNPNVGFITFLSIEAHCNLVLLYLYHCFFIQRKWRVFPWTVDDFRCSNKTDTTRWKASKILFAYEAYKTNTTYIEKIEKKKQSITYIHYTWYLTFIHTIEDLYFRMRSCLEVESKEHSRW